MVILRAFFSTGCIQVLSFVFMQLWSKLCCLVEIQACCVVELKHWITYKLTLCTAINELSTFLYSGTYIVTIISANSKNVSYSSVLLWVSLDFYLCEITSKQWKPLHNRPLFRSLSVHYRKGANLFLPGWEGHYTLLCLFIVPLHVQTNPSKMPNPSV